MFIDKGGSDFRLDFLSTAKDTVGTLRAGDIPLERLHQDCHHHYIE